MTYGSPFGISFDKFDGSGARSSRPGGGDPIEAVGTRVGDAERQQVVDVLVKAHSLGQLDLEEFDERSERAWKAKTRGDLAPLTLDLPTGGPTFDRPGPRGQRRGFTPPTGAVGWLKVVLLAMVAMMVVSIVVGQLLFFWPLWLVVWLVMSGRIGGRRHWHADGGRRRY